MINEPALKDSLLALAEQCKTQHIAVSAATNEVAALREMLREATGDTFAVAFENHQIAQIARTALLESAVTQLLDGIIQRLKDGEVC